MNSPQEIADEIAKMSRHDDPDRAARMIETALRLIYRNGYLDGEARRPEPGWEL